MELYWREGLYRFSLSEICRRTGLSKPALYREFGGEDGLMDAALERYRRQVVAPLFEAMEEKRPFAEMLHRAVLRLTEARPAPAGCLFTKMRLARERLGRETSKRVREIEREQRALFESRFLRARADGEVDPEIPASRAARYLDTQFATVLVLMGSGTPRERVREHAALALRTLLPGRPALDEQRE